MLTYGPLVKANGFMKKLVSYSNFYFSFHFIYTNQWYESI